MKRLNRRRIAVFLMIALLISSLQMVTTADAPLTESVIEKPLESIDASGETVMPLDMNIDNYVYITLKTAATVMYAPHPNVSASTGYNLAAGTQVHTFGRTYDYYYIGWYIGTKLMYGYVPVSAVNKPSTTTWISYDIYRPATCSATTTVLAGAGTTNTFMQTGTIYANETPLMVLGQYTNKYNNRIYYYVEYMTSDLKAKRGWIDADTGTVTKRIYGSTSAIQSTTEYFAFISKNSSNSNEKKALTWNKNSTNNVVEQQPFTGAFNQLFFLEATTYDGSLGYYKIISADDPNMAVTVSSTGYSEGLPIVMETKGSPNKRQEFRISNMLYSSNSFEETAEVNDQTINVREVHQVIQTRASGEYRAIGLYSGNSSLIQSVFTGADHQIWELVKVKRPYNGTYGQSDGGSAFPGNYKVYVNTPTSSFYTTSIVQECLNRWNAVYSRLSLQTATTMPQTSRLAIVTENTASDEHTLASTYYKQFNGGFEESANSDSNWHSCRIELYSQNHYYSDSTAYSPNVRKKILTHEFGHALKLPHTFQEYYEGENGTRYWVDRRYGLTLMDQGAHEIGQPTALDIQRLKNKWDSVS